MGFTGGGTVGLWRVWTSWPKFDWRLTSSVAVVTGELLITDCFHDVFICMVESSLALDTEERNDRYFICLIFEWDCVGLNLVSPLDQKITTFLILLKGKLCLDSL